MSRSSNIILLVGLVFALLLIGLWSRQGGALALALPLLVYLGAALLKGPAKSDLSVSRQVSSSRVVQGTPVEVKTTIRNQGAAVEEFRAVELLPGGVELLEGETSSVAYLPAGGELTLKYTIRPGRGEYGSYEMGTTCSEMLGLFANQSTCLPEGQLVVQPRYTRLKAIEIRPPQTRGFAGPILARQGGAGVDFFSVREYQAGDPQRRINWKMAGRASQELFTNVFEQERVADVGLVLDARQQSNIHTAQDSLFEHSVQATAALAERFLSDGNRVSLLVYGGGMQGVFPGYGKVQLNRILQALSGSSTGFSYVLEDFGYIPTRFFPSGSQIVLVSPLLPKDARLFAQLRSRGYAVMLVSPDPVEFEARVYRDATSAAFRAARAERQLLLNKVRQAGVPVVDWKVQQPLDSTIREALSRQPLRQQRPGRPL